MADVPKPPVTGFGGPGPKRKRSVASKKARNAPLPSMGDAGIGKAAGAAGKAAKAFKPKPVTWAKRAANAAQKARGLAEDPSAVPGVLGAAGLSAGKAVGKGAARTGKAALRAARRMAAKGIKRLLMTCLASWPCAATLLVLVMGGMLFGCLAISYLGVPQEELDYKLDDTEAHEYSLSGGRRLETRDAEALLDAVFPNAFGIDPITRVAVVEEWLGAWQPRYEGDTINRVRIAGLTDPDEACDLFGEEARVTVKIDQFQEESIVAVDDETFSVRFAATCHLLLATQRIWVAALAALGPDGFVSLGGLGIKHGSLVDLPGDGEEHQLCGGSGFTMPAGTLASGTWNSVMQWEDAVCEVFGTGIDAAKALCAMSYESAGYPNVTHINRNGSVDLGLLQINDGWWQGWDGGNAWSTDIEEIFLDGGRNPAVFLEPGLNLEVGRYILRNSANGWANWYGYTGERVDSKTGEWIDHETTCETNLGEASRPSSGVPGDNITALGGGRVRFAAKGGPKPVCPLGSTKMRLFNTEHEICTNPTDMESASATLSMAMAAVTSVRGSAQIVPVLGEPTAQGYKLTPVGRGAAQKFQIKCPGYQVADDPPDGAILLFSPCPPPYPKPPLCPPDKEDHDPTPPTLWEMATVIPGQNPGDEPIIIVPPARPLPPHPPDFSGHFAVDDWVDLGKIDYYEGCLEYEKVGEEEFELPDGTTGTREIWELTEYSRGLLAWATNHPTPPPPPAPRLGRLLHILDAGETEAALAIGDALDMGIIQLDAHFWGVKFTDLLHVYWARDFPEAPMAEEQTFNEMVDQWAIQSLGLDGDPNLVEAVLAEPTAWRSILPRAPMSCHWLLEMWGCGEFTNILGAFGWGESSAVIGGDSGLWPIPGSKLQPDPEHRGPCYAITRTEERPPMPEPLTWAVMITEEEAEDDHALVPIPAEYVIGGPVYVRPCILGSIIWLLESFDKYYTRPIRVVSAWRSPEHQDRLRQRHCSGPLGTPGEGKYEEYEYQAYSACVPPTAYPGRSMHQSGLAIDFFPCEPPKNAEDYFFTPYDVPCVKWFLQYAHEVGLYTLDDCRNRGNGRCRFQNFGSWADFDRWYEPWHWSVDGK